jgi:hypothetical protein
MGQKQRVFQHNQLGAAVRRVASIFADKSDFRRHSRPIADLGVEARRCASALPKRTLDLGRRIYISCEVSFAVRKLASKNALERSAPTSRDPNYYSHGMEVFRGFSTLSSYTVCTT